MKRFWKFLFLCAVPFLIYFTIENVLVGLVEILRPELWDVPEFPLAATAVMDLLTIPLLFGIYRADGVRGQFCRHLSGGQHASGCLRHCLER